MPDYSFLIPLSARRPYLQFVVSLLLLLLFSLSGILLTILSSWLIFGIAPGELNMDMLTGNGKHIAYFKFLQAFQHIFVFLIPSLVIAWFMNRKALNYIGADRNPGAGNIILSVLFIIFLVPLTSYLGWLNQGIEIPDSLGGLETWMQEKELRAENLTRALINTGTTGGLLVNLLILSLVPAFGEEFLFRGVFQQIFRAWTRSGNAAVIITAIIFSFMHFQFFGFLPRLILGLSFGYMFLWTGNIWLPVTAHAVNNAIPVIGSWLRSWDEINTSVNEYSSADGYFAVIPSIVALAILLYFRRRGSAKN